MSLGRKLAKRLSSARDINSPGARYRARRIAPLLRMVEHCHQRDGACRILDIGGTRQYWNIIPEDFLQQHQVSIHVLNIPGTPQPENQGRFHFSVGDACDLQDMDDHAFHIAHSNSVIEHVGDWPRMQAYAEEARRVGEGYFIQTPNYWFPVEPHCMTPFFHWLPKPHRLALVQRFQLGYWDKANSVDQAVRTVESARLLNKAMFHSLFPDTSDLITEKALGLAKSLIAVRYPATL